MSFAEVEDDNNYMSPSYFRMLQQPEPSSPVRPSSPRRRLEQPMRQPGSSEAINPPPGTEFIGSAPSPNISHGISEASFSPGYLERFFTEERELGRGGKGVVLLLKHKLDGVDLGYFACKRVPVGDDHSWLVKVLTEVQLLQTLSHQNLVSYRHVWLENYQITQFGPSVPCAFILQQYCNAGDLQHYVLDPAQQTMSKEQMKERMRRRSKGQLEAPVDLFPHKTMAFEEIFSFFRDITSGLHHLHSHRYIHRDLKPSNCLLHRTEGGLKVLVSDFGEVQLESTTRKSTGATGTVAYCAPEVLRGAPGGIFGNFTTKSDVFSLGMIVYFMCFGRLPYGSADDINNETEDIDQLREEIMAWAGVNEGSRSQRDLPDKLYHALKSLLAINPSDRPSTDEILRAVINNRNASVAEELDHSPHPDILEDRVRISNVDSTSPAPSRVSSSKNLARLSLKKFAPPGPSHLRNVSPEGHRVPSPPKSPSKENLRASTATQQTALIMSRRTSPDHPASPTRRPPSPSKQPLALPPPPGLSYRIEQMYANPAIHGAFKIILFLAKYVSITRPCAPFAARAWLSFPLILLAALDFVSLPLSALFDIQKSLALLVVHIVAAGTASRTGVLCASY